MIFLKRYLLLLFLAAGTVSASDFNLTARQALINMTKAMATLNYLGTVAFFRNGKLETMKYFHAAKDGVEQERLLSLNSPLREVVRDAGRVSCRFKDTQQILIDHRPYERSFLLDIPKNIDDMGDIYQLELVGEEDIAMLPSYVIRIRPKDEFRYDRKIWIEKQKFLPLKVAVYDLSGEILEQVVFTEQKVIEELAFVDVKLPDSLEELPHSHSLEDRPKDRAPFIVGNMPAGFHDIFFTRSSMRNSVQPVPHLVLSDGFSIVSVYMENKNPAMQTGLQSAGAVNSFSLVQDNYLITVMGEVPVETVKIIAESSKLKDPEK